jgi:hypothetical protein
MIRVFRALLTALLLISCTTALAGCSGGGGSAPSGAPTTATTGVATTAAPAVTATELTTTPGSVPFEAGCAVLPPGAAQVVSARTTQPWLWPNVTSAGAAVTHAVTVPPVPELIAIDFSQYPSVGEQNRFDRLSFTFDTTAPGYRFEFVDRLTGDPSGKPVAVAGLGVLRVVFSPAQAHRADGSAGTITSAPARPLGGQRLVDYAAAGDSEAVLTYGLGVTWPIPHSNPQFPVRTCESEAVTTAGVHLFTVSVDIDAENPVSR